MYRYLLLSIVFFIALCHINASQPRPPADTEDNEFAEFEEFDDAEDPAPNSEAGAEKSDDAAVPTEEKPAVTTDEDDDTATVEDEDDFDHFADEDEFEGFDKDKSSKPGAKEKIPDLKITKIPIHLLTSWDSYFLELLMLSGLIVYFLNFLLGKTKNSVISQAWYNCHKDLLQANFSLIGDDESLKEAPTQPGTFIKRTENIYALWCSGRTCVEGMLVELRLLKRQDIITTIQKFFKPSHDQIVITVNFEPNIMARFVFAIGQKRSITKLFKDMSDLSVFCEKKSVEPLGLSSNYNLVTELSEASNAVLDSKVLHVLKKYEGWIDYIHISDQYSGVKSQDDNQQAKTVETKPVLIACLNIVKSGKAAMAEMKELKESLKLVFYLIDKIDKFKLSREAKMKSDKNRQKSEAVIHKAKHAERQEAAQQRKEDKRRVEKERLMNEEDPEKARKLEERDNKRELKRRQPKMKTMKAMM